MEENTTNQDNQEAEMDQKGKLVTFSLKRFLVYLRDFIKSVVNLREGVDYKATTEGIIQDVHFRGHAAWILVFSILIASIGLNTNSVAVIIGAMLISPLMGPILAIGFAIGTNDFELLKRAIKNFGIAIGISLLISALYFAISPIKEVSAELMDRTSATVLALAVAFFGGAAGIIAGSRRYKSNVVPGVAIATALMPPLCTAGYGLATFQWNYFFGASYLFFINSVFIALPTYLYIKYMRFPVAQFVDPAREKKIKRYILAFLIVVMVPSAIIFWKVVNQSIFSRKADVYVTQFEQSLEGTGTAIISQKRSYNDGKPVITIALMGDVIPEQKIDAWKLKLNEYGLEDCQFNVVQSKDYLKLIEDAENRSLAGGSKWLENMVATKDEEILQLRSELDLYQKNKVDFDAMIKEAAVLFPDVQKMMIAEGVESDFNQQDTLWTLFVRFRPNVDQAVKWAEMNKLSKWTSIQAKKDSVRIIEY